MNSRRGAPPGLWTALEADPFSVRQPYEQVAARLTGEVRAGSLRGGDRLPGERELARALGVGRPAVREALAALAEVGIVEIRPASGTYVSTTALRLIAAADQDNADLVSDTSPVALLDARMLFEPLVAEQTARLGRADREIETLLDQMDAVVDLADPLQRQAWNEADRLFHRRLAECVGNPVLTLMADLIATTMDEPLWRRLRNEAVAEPTRKALYAAEHRLIYEAVRDGDRRSAAYLARLHLMHVRRDMGLDPPDDRRLGPERPDTPSISEESVSEAVPR